MRFHRLTFLTLAALATAIASPALAQQCGDRAKVVAMLTEKYEETSVVTALTDAGLMMEIFASKKGTWTVVHSEPGSTIVCLIATGTGWDKPPSGMKDT